MAEAKLVRVRHVVGLANNQVACEYCSLWDQLRLATGSGMAMQWEKAQQQECWGSQDQECVVHGTETGPKGFEPCDLKWDGPWDQGSFGPGECDGLVHRTKRDMVH